MHIALLSEGLYPDKIGGIQKHSFLLMQELAREGIYVDVYTHTHEKYDIHCHIPSDLLPFLKLITLPFRVFHLYFPGHFLYESWLRSKELNDLVKGSSQEYDFIYIQGFAGMAYLRAPLRAPTSILNFHGLEMYQRAASPKLKLQHIAFRPFVRYCIRLADYNVSLGGNLTTILSNLANGKNILETPIGIDASWLCQDEVAEFVNEPRSYVFVGRFERRKGIQELHEAIREIGATANFSMTFIGPVPETEQLPFSNIRYVGLIRDQNVIRATLLAADVLVCPSWSEGMPTVILEGMSSGCAIIATDVGATAKLVSSNNGWLIPAGDVVALRSALESASCISHFELVKMKRNSLSHVKNNFTWNKVIKLFLRQLQDINEVEA